MTQPGKFPPRDALVLSTLERPEWERGTQAPLMPGELVGGRHDFIEVRVRQASGQMKPGTQEQQHTGA
jgi:hypothetical protein